MLFSKTIKLLICLVIIMPYIVQAPQASAAVNYDHNALLEYKGYGEAVYETVVEQTTFITGQYTDNKQYVKDSMGQIKDYANFWLNEQGTIHDACSGTQIFTKNCLGELTSSAGGYALTVGDFIKNLFTDYDKSIPVVNEPDYSFYENAFTWRLNYEKRPVLTLKNGWTAEFEYKGQKTTHTAKEGLNNDIFVYLYNDYTWDIYYRFYVAGFPTMGPKIGNDPSSEVTAARNHFNANSGSVGGMMSLIYKAGGSIKVFYEGVEKPFVPTIPQRPMTDINNYIQESTPKMVAPQPKAYLSCPDGTRIDMAINGSTFLDASGQVMNVNRDGTAQISSQICNLGWEKQQVDYVDDKPAITDPDGNWLDLITGELLECVVLEKCEVSTKPPGEVEPIDNSLVEYVKNAYEYATSVLKTATDGLKSLGEGAKELTALFGVFFGWLPKEMVVLMSSGLGIAIGLRLFRK
ncbi:hypothetical protein [Solibacillus sp. NPDC093137]|uniref:hypothetical protein n=1 Tax=Solibacillus sp. NPDC093137 TaxID=3390678 RepID=UPI003D07BBCB